MEVLDQVKETVENIVNDVSTNFSGVQEKAEMNIEKVRSNAMTAWSSIKDELTNQSSHMKEYSDRITSKFNKHFKEFNRETLVNDVKEEVEFFSNEMKSSVERVKAGFAK